MNSKIAFFLFVLTNLALTNTIICQPKISHGSISASWFTFLAPRQEITPFYNAMRDDVSLSSTPRVSFAGKLQYNHTLNEHLDLSLGVTVGSYPFDINYSYDSTFSVEGRNYSDFHYDRYSSVYGSIGLSFTYYKRLSIKQSIAFKLGCGYTFFIPQFYIYTRSSQTNTGVYQTLLFDANMNPNEKGFLAPDISLQYYYEVAGWLIPFVSITGVYSKNYPIVGNRYIIFGKTENLRGTFRRRFLQAGIDIGIKLTIPSSKNRKLIKYG